ncbi:DUF362 domain-containing protein [Zongyangia hominis]|uniref:Ferredoxin n=1 Tax=Zongyangia hominis TaxID=2763677 RepID=A0A926IBI6_9FIRM|nr:DUF362 domain-containing protein [Zongyangia hominis]MBC8570135.1 DUF362 domain-containing protein [Zongyangia hominis]
MSFAKGGERKLEKVSVIETPSYDQTVVNAAVARHFQLHGMEEKLHPGMKVLVKPNLLLKRRPEEFTTTHPTVVEAVIEALKGYGVTDIVIADSPGGLYTRVQLAAIYRASGMEDVARRQGVALNLETGSGEVSAPGARCCARFTLIDPVRRADMVVSVGKVKTHGMTGLSGGVKNLFGCIPGLMKPELHCQFPEKGSFGHMLVDLCECVRPGFTVMDGVEAMEGDGPSGGTMRRVGLTFAAENPYALDLGLCRLMGLDESSVPTIAAAKERGLSGGYGEGMEIVGDFTDIAPIPGYQKPRSASVDFSAHVPRMFRRPVAWLEKKASPKPVIRRQGCIGCGKCAESCPQKTIAIVEKKARIDYSRCIKCFCCHEMCPVKTIDIKRNLILHR